MFVELQNAQSFPPGLTSTHSSQALGHRPGFNFKFQDVLGDLTRSVRCPNPHKSMVFFREVKSGCPTKLYRQILAQPDFAAVSAPPRAPNSGPEVPSTLPDHVPPGSLESCLVTQGAEGFSVAKSAKSDSPGIASALRDRGEGIDGGGVES